LKKETQGPQIKKLFQEIMQDIKNESAFLL